MKTISTGLRRQGNLPERVGTMSRRPPSFKQSDVKRALKAARDGGLDVGRVEIDAEGKIVLIARTEASDSVTPLEKWKKEHARPS